MAWRQRDPGAVETVEEWHPFLRAAQEARLEELDWMLDPLDFRLIGWIERKGRRPLSVYVHVRTGGDLTVDPDGLAHRVTLDRAQRIRSKVIDISAALWQTGVPREELEREPRHHARHAGWDTCAPCQVWIEEEDAAWLADQEAKRELRRAKRAAKSAEGQQKSTEPTPSERHLRVVPS